MTPISNEHLPWNAGLKVKHKATCKAFPSWEITHALSISGAGGGVTWQRPGSLHNDAQDLHLWTGHCCSHCWHTDLSRLLVFGHHCWIPPERKEHWLNVMQPNLKYIYQYIWSIYISHRHRPDPNWPSSIGTLVQCAPPPAVLAYM